MKGLFLLLRIKLAMWLMGANSKVPNRKEIGERNKKWIDVEWNPEDGIAKHPLFLEYGNPIAIKMDVSTLCGLVRTHIQILGEIKKYLPNEMVVNVNEIITNSRDIINRVKED